MKKLLMNVCAFTCLLSATSGFAKKNRTPKLHPPMVYQHKKALFSNAKVAKPALAMQIEAMNASHVAMKSELSATFETLSNSADYGEQMLQHIMNLVDAELVIVNHLMYGRTGAMLEDAMLARNHMLAQSMPSVAYMYDKILDLATADADVNPKLYESGRNGKSLAYALNWSDKKDFLRGVRSKLTHYQKMLRAMQCDFAIDSAEARIQVPINSDGSMSFCPVIN